jgi:hypothetical protein
MVSRHKYAPYPEYMLLLIAYTAIRIPDVVAIDAFAALIFPLNFLYYAKLLFSGMAVNPSIADTVIAPANASLIYPPGIYILSAALGSVRSIFYFLFFIQAAVPILVFRLLLPVTSRLFSFATAILVTYYCTSARTWYPDFIVQPLMLGILVFLMARKRQLSYAEVAACGLACGAIVVLKHNVGIFFAVLCGTQVFFRSCSLSSESQGHRSLAYFLLAGFFAFGLVFFSRLPHLDEAGYYLLPYFAFWIYIALLFSRGLLHLDGIAFTTRIIPFTLFGLAIPLFVFLQFGNVIGFRRYWHSLFGMGFDHIAFWDNGILAIVGSYLNTGGLWVTYSSAIVVMVLIGPFFINLVGVGQLFRSGQGRAQVSLERIMTISLGVMAIFMLFPLEDHKIAFSKFFIFIYVFVTLLRNVAVSGWRTFGLVTLVMLLPVSYISWRNLQQVARVPTLDGSPVIQKVIGLPLDRHIALELGAQVEVLTRAIKGAPYFVLTSPAYNLLTLPILVENGNPQYYVRFDAAAMSKEVVRDTLVALANVPFVVVATGDYHDFVAGKTEDTNFRELMNYVATAFVAVDGYSKVGEVSLSTRHLDPFLVLKRRAL